MKTTILALGLSVVAVPAFAQVHVSVGVPAPPRPVAPPAPSITFVAPPPLVTVEPGIQVVEDQADEVFFVDNYYWVRRDGHWWRSANHRGGWAYVDGPGVPGALVKVPNGHYRRYKHNKGGGHGATSVTVNPPGPGKVKVKVKGKH
jgi:hypothetical protein